MSVPEHWKLRPGQNFRLLQPYQFDLFQFHHFVRKAPPVEMDWLKEIADRYCEEPASTGNMTRKPSWL